MLCKKCGKEYADDLKKCPECGKKKESAEEKQETSAKAKKKAAPAKEKKKEKAKPAYNPFSGPPIDTPTSQLDYAALRQHYKQAVKHPPRNIFFWASKILMAAALICFFTPFISGSLNLFHVYESEKYSGYEYMLEAKDFLQNADNSISLDDEGVIGAWVTLLILALGFIFMLAALFLRRGYGTFALGALAVYGIFFAVIRAIGSDETLNHSVEIRPGAGLIVNIILLAVVFAFSLIDRGKARAVIRGKLGIV